jgi:photosystem II stability/assembly factor-like uncharacterized protein
LANKVYVYVSAGLFSTKCLNSGINESDPAAAPVFFSKGGIDTMKYVMPVKLICIIALTGMLTSCEYLFLAKGIAPTVITSVRPGYNAMTQYYSDGYISAADSGFIYFRDNWNIVQTLYTVPGAPDLLDIAPAIPIPADFPDVVIIVGANGTIVRNTEQNREWTLIDTPVEEHLNRIEYCFEDGIVTFYAVGNSGAVLRSSDLGMSWEVIPIPLTDNLYDVHISGTNLNSVFFNDENTGVAVGDYGIILRTTDGGNEWVQQHSDRFEDLHSAYFTDSQSGIAVGDYGTILRTTDGGENWDEIFWGAIFHNHDVYFSDHNTGWTVGSQGVILKTTDGGLLWSGQDSNTELPLHSIHFVDNNTGSVAGAGGIILLTTDGGENWVQQESGTSNTLRGIFFTDTQNGIAVGDFGTILGTTDGGVTWSPRQSGGLDHLYSVSFADSANGKIVGARGIILTTGDAGSTWSPQGSGTTTRLRDVHLTHGNAGATVGDAGMIVRMSPEFSGWSASRPMGCNRIIVAGDNLGLYTTVNFGTDWLDVSSAPIDPINFVATGNSYNRIYFHDDTLGFTVGSLGMISKTTDGGRTWYSAGFADGLGEINDLYFISPDSGVIGGAHGYARFTTNGGETWFEDSAVTGYLDGRNVKRIVPLSSRHAFVVIENLEIFIADNAAYLDSVFVVTSVNKDKLTVDGYVLHQNYPNPFNPATSIEFRIPAPGRVTLKVYDTVGREVATLIDDEKNAGVYTVGFDASYLSSGAYFYTLTAGEFAETKRLLFIK